MDSVWLGKVAPKLYRHYIGHLMADKPKFVPAALFYALFILGMVVFVLVPALDRRELSYVLTRAPLFGLVTYATFDLTSQAVLKNWPWQITVIDLAWGVVITTVTASISYLLGVQLVVK